LTGRAPFHATSPQELRAFYERSDQLRPSIPSGTSPQLAELICSLLRKNPKERLQAADFFRHPFMRDGKMRKKYPSSSPTIPEAKGRTPSPLDTSSSNNSRPSSQLGSFHQEECCLVSAGDEEEFVLISAPRQRARTVADFGGHHHQAQERAIHPRTHSLTSHASNVPRSRSSRHLPESPLASPSHSPTSDQFNNNVGIKRAHTQPELLNVGQRGALAAMARPSVPSDLKYRADPRQVSPRHTTHVAPYNRHSPPNTTLARRTDFTVGTPPECHGSMSLMPLPEEVAMDSNNNEPPLLDQLHFSYELGEAIGMVAKGYKATTFRKRGERTLLYYKGLQVFLSALHKARNSDLTELKTDDKANIKAILMKLHDKFKQCRQLCNEQEETRKQAEKQKELKLYSADAILYDYAMKTCEDTACADTSGEMNEPQLREKYAIAATLLKGLIQTFDCPEDKKKLLLYQNQISSRLAELKAPDHDGTTTTTIATTTTSK
jgi:hypothetical protein